MAVLLAQHHEEVALDINPARVARLNVRQPTVDDADVANVGSMGLLLQAKKAGLIAAVAPLLELLNVSPVYWV